MNSSSRLFSFILALALVMLAAYPAYADDATSTPSTDTATATTTDTTSGTTDTAAADTSATTTQSASSEGTATESATTTSETTSTTTQNAIDDSASATTTSATSTEADTSVSATSTGDAGAVSSTSDSSATTTSETATTTEAFSSTTPEAPATTTLLAGLATSTEQSLGTTTDTGAGATSTATGSPAIETGDASAGANIVNVAGSNFVNSSGEIVLSNYFTPSSGIDLRNATSAYATGVLCMLFTCTGSGGVTLNLTSTSTLTNLLVVNATSGGNLITGNGSGTASILTGSAFAGLNLVNIANLNVIDSTYLLVALNAFRGITGDIVFPGLAGFFAALPSGTAPGSVTLDSNAVVDNQLTMNAGTGGNQTNASSSTVATGSTLSLATLLNQLNGSQIGGANLAILLRIQGAWNGQIYSAPDGLSVIRGGDGSVLLLKSGMNPALLADATVTATTTASIMNHIDLGAFTGDNGIFGVDSANITTGNAFIGANIFNLANQNIIGKNWLTAIINVFGDFNGNIAFGRPDLWVGEQVEAPAHLTRGSDVVFHFTITNKGDAPATNAAFTASLDPASLAVADPTATDLGTLAPGASADIVIHARVTGGGGDIPTSGTAGETEPDNNSADNTDSVTLHMARAGGGGSSLVSHSFSAALPLVVTRSTVSAVVTAANRTVHEELSVSNPNDATSTVIDLHDLLTDPEGTVIDDQAWPLDTLAPHEEVKITYDIAFKDDAPPGRYTLSTVLASENGDTEFKDNGTIVILALPAVHAASVAHPSHTAPVVTRAIASTSPSSLPAAALLSRIPWTYALGFVAAAAALAGILWSAIVMRRRFLG